MEDSAVKRLTRELVQSSWLSLSCWGVVLPRLSKLPRVQRDWKKAIIFYHQALGERLCATGADRVDVDTLVNALVLITGESQSLGQPVKCFPSLLISKMPRNLQLFWMNFLGWHGMSASESESLQNAFSALQRLESHILDFYAKGDVTLQLKILHSEIISDCCLRWVSSQDLDVGFQNACVAWQMDSEEWLSEEGVVSTRWNLPLERLHRQTFETAVKEVVLTVFLFRGNLSHYKFERSQKRFLNDCRQLTLHSHLSSEIFMHWASFLLRLFEECPLSKISIPETGPLRKAFFQLPIAPHLVLGQASRLHASQLGSRSREGHLPGVVVLRITSFLNWGEHWGSALTSDSLWAAASLRLSESAARAYLQRTFHRSSFLGEQAWHSDHSQAFVFQLISKLLLFQLHVQLKIAQEQGSFVPWSIQEGILKVETLIFKHFRNIARNVEDFAQLQNLLEEVNTRFRSSPRNAFSEHLKRRRLV